MSLYTELKDRKVIRVAAVYLVAAWLIVQVVVAVSGPLLLPDWFARAIILLLIAGFPFALIISWAFDATPAEDNGGGKGKPLAIALIVATAITLGFILTHFNSNESEPDMVAEASIEEAIVVELSEEIQELLPNSVAVLPFDNLSTDPENAFFAAGIHEETLNQLAKLSHLSVISRTSMLRYENSELSIPEIASELNVETVLEGSVRYAGGRVRITAQLIEAGTDKHLWSEVYEREFSDIFAIQSDIATNIANALNAEFSLEEQAAIESIPTNSTDAYRFYLQAVSINTGPTETAAARNRAIDLLEQAIVLDPNFALAYARIGDISIYRVGEIGVAEAAKMMFETSEKALSIDPNISLALSNLAWVNAASLEWSSALDAINKAIALSPNDPEILIRHAQMAAYTGDCLPAMDSANKSVVLGGQNFGGVLQVYILCGEYERATEFLLTEAELNSNSLIVWLELSRLASQRGDYEEALVNARRAESNLNASGNGLNLVVYAYRLAGSESDALRLYETGLTEYPSSNDQAYRMINIVGLLGAGRIEETLQQIELLSRDDYNLALPDAAFMAINAFDDPVLEQPKFVEVRRRLLFRD